MKLYPRVMALVITTLFCISAVGQPPDQTPSISMGIVLDTSGSMTMTLDLLKAAAHVVISDVIVDEQRGFGDDIVEGTGDFGADITGQLPSGGVAFDDEEVEDVRALLEAKEVQTQITFEEHHPLIRELSEYGIFVRNQTQNP